MMSLSAFLKPCAVLLLSLILPRPALSTTTAAGPTAYISVASLPAWATMRQCAKSCLIYQGIWHCGVNSGYHDLGLELACGCSPQNFCFCDQKAAVSASSYISSCVLAGCGTAFPEEVSSVIDMYDGYCATANVEVEAQTTAEPVTTTSAGSTTAIATPKVTGIARSSATSTGGQVAKTGSVEVTAPTENTKDAEKKGLAQSDIIALAVGLGVGGPSLLLALGTFCLQRKNRIKRQREEDNVAYIVK